MYEIFRLDYNKKLFGVSLMEYFNFMCQDSAQ